MSTLGVTLRLQSYSSRIRFSDKVVLEYHRGTDELCPWLWWVTGCPVFTCQHLPWVWKAIDRDLPCDTFTTIQSLQITLHAWTMLSLPTSWPICTRLCWVCNPQEDRRTIQGRVGGDLCLKQMRLLGWVVWLVMRWRPLTFELAVFMECLYGETGLLIKSYERWGSVAFRVLQIV